MHFQGEPAIDEGGVRKEFFMLLFKELFCSDRDMFIYNPDTRMYYFNGNSFEPPMYFELIGTLIALAPMNDCLLDIPLLSSCYKSLLDK